MTVSFGDIKMERTYQIKWAGPKMAKTAIQKEKRKTEKQSWRTNAI